MRTPVLLLVGWLLGTGCASAQKALGERDAGRCPEFAHLTCLSATECSMDVARGCRVCQCAKPWVDPSESGFDRPLPPDHR